MKPLNTSELNLICEDLSRLKSSPLQEIRFHHMHLEFGFWAFGQKSWWHLSLHPLLPLLLPMPQPRLSKKSQNKPIYLFLKAHALGKSLDSIACDKKLGRVIHLALKGREHSIEPTYSRCELEMRLFPHGQNLIVRTENKTLSMKPIKDLEELKSTYLPTTCRSLGELSSEFQALHEDQRASSSSISEHLWKQKVTHIEKALQKVSQELEKKRQLPWGLIGKHLVETQSLNVPNQWSFYTDSQKSLAWNIEKCFAKEKAKAQKILGTEARKRELEEKLQSLEKQGHSHNQGHQSKESQHEGSQRKKGQQSSLKVRARKRILQEGLEAWVGKNAKENIKLLRQSKPWDLWVHLVDEPSSHAIIRRARGKEVSPNLLMDVGRWVVHMTFGEKSKKRQGDHFQILYTECRYVSPIKGDKLGRVIYRHEKILGFKFL